MCALQQTQMVTPLQLYFSFKMAFTNAQVSAFNPLPYSLLTVPKPWRAFTTFFYFGTISLDFVFHMFFL